MLDLRRAEIAIDGERRFSTERRCQSLGEGNSATNGNEVDILRRAVQEQVAHIAANDITRLAHAVGNNADSVKNFIV